MSGKLLTFVFRITNVAGPQGPIFDPIIAFFTEYYTDILFYFFETLLNVTLNTTRHGSISMGFYNSGQLGNVSCSGTACSVTANIKETERKNPPPASTAIINILTGSK